jgi:hypothetical protein
MRRGETVVEPESGGPWEYSAIVGRGANRHWQVDPLYDSEKDGCKRNARRRGLADNNTRRGHCFATFLVVLVYRMHGIDLQHCIACSAVAVGLQSNP